MQQEFWELYATAAKTAAGFFWKSGWAFVLGYFVSSMIQAFVPKGRLTPYMGKANSQGISLAALFGSASSSCSFAALATARSLILKGAHFTAGVAFMFASTNLVIELGILILIFLGWQFLAAEILGGLLLIVISTILIQATYPHSWLESARQRLEEEAKAQEEAFDWKERISSPKGWRLVGHQFVMEWKMVWEDILIGFTVAGFVAVLVPSSFWAAIFLNDLSGQLPAWLVALENAVVAPFVAALTFIGSMGNIPLASVLHNNGVLFAGIMGFIYSDLMVPPLVRVNAKYYGWRVALYIAGVMYVSAVATALVLHGVFSALAAMPESSRETSQIVQFAVDYTFWLNLAFGLLAAGLVLLHRRHLRTLDQAGSDASMGGGPLKRAVVYLFIAILCGGLIARIWLDG